MMLTFNAFIHLNEVFSPCQGCTQGVLMGCHVSCAHTSFSVGNPPTRLWRWAEVKGNPQVYRKNIQISSRTVTQATDVTADPGDVKQQHYMLEPLCHLKTALSS